MRSDSRRNKPTMQMIADELGLSKSLVSKALANKHGVSEETKRQILLTASRVGYRINSSVMTVGTSRTGTITLLLPREDLKDLEYWGQIIHSIEDELSSRLFSLILSGVDMKKASSLALPSCITDAKVDGAIVMGRISATYVHAIHTKGIPVVLLDADNYGNPTLDHIMADNFGGGYNATEFVLEKNHRRVAFIGDLSYSYSFRERHRGFLACVERYRRSHPHIAFEVVEITAPSEDPGCPFSTEQLRTTLRNHKTLPTVLVCANDPTAFIAIKEMDKMGFRCPDDISVIGFDNLNNDRWLDPQLTSVDARISSMGRRAVELLLKRLEEPQRRSEILMITTEVVERASVKQLQEQ